MEADECQCPECQDDIDNVWQVPDVECEKEEEESE